jgi:hypothetical protein
MQLYRTHFSTGSIIYEENQIILPNVKYRELVRQNFDVLQISLLQIHTSSTFFQVHPTAGFYPPGQQDLSPDPHVYVGELEHFASPCRGHQ